jgi:predicted amidohydrolase
VVQIAEAQDGPYATQLSELAVEHGMYVVFGTSEPVEGDDDHAYNSAFVCTPEGEVLAYRKIVPVEGPWCVAGTEPLVVQTPFGALGLSICKDTYAAPEIARYYAARGCTYLLNPTARTGTAAGWEDLYRNAIENLADQDKMIVVSADLCGADLDAPAEQAGWDLYTGASAVVAPLGGAEDGSYVRVWGSLSSDPSACGLVVAEVDYEDLWLGLGGAIYFFNPELYAALYRGAEFECTTADLSAA